MLAGVRYFDGIPIVRSQDNYVVQWADPDGESPEKAKPLGSAKPRLQAELDRPAAFAAPWSEERLFLDRARVLRRLGRIDEACAAWSSLTASPGRLAVVAAIELAKLREHRLRDPVGALEIATRGLATAERRRRIGRPEPALEANLERRIERLRRRVAAARPRSRMRPAPQAEGASAPQPSAPPVRRAAAADMRRRIASRVGTEAMPGPSTNSDAAAAPRSRS